MKDTVNLRERIQEELAFTNSQFSLSYLRPFSNDGYEILCYAKKTRILEISMTKQQKVEHHIDIGNGCPLSVIESIPGKNLGEIVSNFGIMRSYWDPESNVEEVIKMNGNDWIVIYPKQ